MSKHVTSYTNEISFNEVYIGKSTDTSRAEDNIYHGSSSYIMNHWQSLDFNENMSTNTAFNDVSWNDVSFFFWEITFKKLFIFKVIYFLFSTDETQISYLLHVIMKQDI